jgi:hypothetical protein
LGQPEHAKDGLERWTPEPAEACEALADLDRYLDRLTDDDPLRWPLVRLRASFAVAAGLPLLAVLPPQ